jgi:hypothetical protein
VFAGRQQCDISRNPEQVRRTQDQSDSCQWISTKGAISRLVMSFATFVIRLWTALPEANQNCLQRDRQSKERSPDEEDTAVSDASRGEIGKERSH